MKKFIISLEAWDGMGDNIVKTLNHFVILTPIQTNNEFISHRMLCEVEESNVGLFEDYIDSLTYFDTLREYVKL